MKDCAANKSRSNLFCLQSQVHFRSVWRVCTCCKIRLKFVWWYWNIDWWQSNYTEYIACPIFHSKFSGPMCILKTPFLCTLSIITGWWSIYCQYFNILSHNLISLMNIVFLLEIYWLFSLLPFQIYMLSWSKEFKLISFWDTNKSVCKMAAVSLELPWLSRPTSKVGIDTLTACVCKQINMDVIVLWLSKPGQARVGVICLKCLLSVWLFEGGITV